MDCSTAAVTLSIVDARTLPVTAGMVVLLSVGILPEGDHRCLASVLNIVLRQICAVASNGPRLAGRPFHYGAGNGTNGSRQFADRI